MISFRDTRDDVRRVGLVQRDIESASPPAAMTSQNYLQLLHNKSDSLPSNGVSYANTNSANLNSELILSPSNCGGLGYITREETYPDLPTLPQKLGIRSKTENGFQIGSLMAPTNHSDTLSEPHVKSSSYALNGDAHIYNSECMDSHRSS